MSKTVLAPHIAIYDYSGAATDISLDPTTPDTKVYTLPSFYIRLFFGYLNETTAKVIISGLSMSFVFG